MRRKRKGGEGYTILHFFMGKVRETEIKEYLICMASYVYQLFVGYEVEHMFEVLKKYPRNCGVLILF